MPRKLGETLSDFAIRTAYEYGHAWNPDNPGANHASLADLQQMGAGHPVVISMLRSFSLMQATEYTVATLKYHNRQPQFDGLIGPAMEDTLQVARCAVPDYVPPPGVAFAFDDPMVQAVCQRMQANEAEPLLGTGSWPSCHGVGAFHASLVRIDDSRLPSFLKPVFLRVLRQVQMSYAALGLLWRFTDQSKKDLLNGEVLTGTVNSEMSFVTSSSGWIGLAIVGQNESCSSTIWCRFLATYKGGSTTDSIATQWTTLIKHELGHNSGLGHSSGGVMNPSIVNGLPTEWTSSDPSTRILQRSFGGSPVPIPGGGGGDPPTPPTTIEQQLRDVQVRNAVQDATINWCISEIRKLKGA